MAERSGPRSRVLVVDNDSTEGDLRALLEREGYEVVLAREAEEALGLMEQSPPDCVISDLELPKIDGHELARRVKADEATRLIPVILITAGGAGVPETVSALDAGADALMAKPINEAEVVARVRSLVHVRGLTLELERAQNVVFALATAIEQKDNYTEGHGERVAIYARSLAEYVGLSAEEINAVHTGGILHDVGKIGCPDAILNKPGPLTPDEFEIIKRHPIHGWEICRHLKSLGNCTLGCIRNHHERLDGSGYPDGLGGDAVPKTVRIMSIADVFDALATARAYKPAFPTATCFKILTEEAERGWWDPELVKAFVEMMREQELDQAKNRAKLEPMFARPRSTES